MSIERKLSDRIIKRKFRVRKKIKAIGGLRVNIFRSLNHIYAQIIDDQNNKTLVSCSSLEFKPKNKGDKKTIAHEIGKELAQRALKAGIKTVILDRGPYLYHGRVKSLADGIREGGLKI